MDYSSGNSHTSGAVVTDHLMAADNPNGCMRCDVLPWLPVKYVSDEFVECHAAVRSTGFHLDLESPLGIERFGTEKDSGCERQDDNWA